MYIYWGHQSNHGYSLVFTDKEDSGVSQYLLDAFRDHARVKDLMFDSYKFMLRHFLSLSPQCKTTVCMHDIVLFECK